MRTSIRPSKPSERDTPEKQPERRWCFELLAKSPLFTIGQAKQYAGMSAGEHRRQAPLTTKTIRGILHPLVVKGYLGYRKHVPLAQKSYFRAQPVYPLPGMGGRLPNGAQLDRTIRQLTAHYPLPNSQQGGQGIVKLTWVYFPTPQYFDEYGDGQELFVDQDAGIPEDSIDPDAQQTNRSVEGLVQYEGRFRPDVELDAFCNREPSVSMRSFHVVVRFLNLTGLFLELTRQRGTPRAEQIRKSWTPCLTYSPKLNLPCSYAVYSPDGHTRVATAFCRNIGAAQLEKIHLRLSRYDAFHIN